MPILTLSDCIAENCNVHVGCECKRIAILSAEKLLAERGDLTLEQLAGKLRCKGCGERPVDVVPRRDTARPALRG